MVWMNVEVDLSDVSDEELSSELRSRGYHVVENDYGEFARSDDHLRMYEAFKLGRINEAMEIARLIAQNETGRIL